MTGICFRWKMLEIRERGGSLGRGGAGKTFWEEMWRGGPSSCCFPKPIYILKAQVITFNEIWASQRHERLQICGLCKNLIFMNLVKEKLWSASNRRYVWDMHPEKRPFKGRPWGPEGHSDWAMHLSSYQEWHGEVWLWAWVRIQQAEQRPQSASQQCQSCASWCLAFIVACFFVCSELPDKQTNKQANPVWTRRHASSPLLAICHSHISRRK